MEAGTAALRPLGSVGRSRRMADLADLEGIRHSPRVGNRGHRLNREVGSRDSLHSRGVGNKGHHRSREVGNTGHHRSSRVGGNRDRRMGRRKGRRRDSIKGRDIQDKVIRGRAMAGDTRRWC